MSFTARVREYLLERRIFLGISAAILAALIMTMVSLRLYTLDDVSRLDVSRPDRQNIRPSEVKDDIGSFGSTGVLNDSSVKQFESLVEKQRDELSKLGTFDGDPLNPDNIGKENTGSE